jgi:hypothetical protein
MPTTNTLAKLADQFRIHYLIASYDSDLYIEFAYVLYNDLPLDGKRFLYPEIGKEIYLLPISG